MKIRILEKSDEFIKLEIDGIDTSIASALRRIMISEVPTMAIEIVDFKKNDSVLNDEIIAHRLGLIPLKFDPKIYNLKEKCKCNGKGCSLCEVRFVLKKKGPCMVYSSDLKSDSKDVKPLYQNIPIVELFEDQELELEAIAVLGYGKDHAKWQGAVVGYSQDQENPDKFLFNIESASGLKTEEIFESALKVFESKLNQFLKELKKLNK